MYKLRFLGKAQEDLKKIDRAHQKLIKEKLLILAKNPKVLKNNIKRLSGTKEDYYRLRIGSYMAFPFQPFSSYNLASP